MTRFVPWLFLLTVVALTWACAASEDSSRLDPAEAGGTPAPDGAPGVCCQPSTGGCAYLGGYIESGKCEYRKTCDNMCEQRIVPGEHGCMRLEYKTPPVQTTYAGPQSCSDPIFNGGGRGRDAGSDAADASDASTAGDGGDGGEGGDGG